jgi:serine/threonine-protein kinase
MKHLNTTLLILCLCIVSFAGAQVVTTLAGSTTKGSANGTGAAASFDLPSGVCADASGHLFVADQWNHQIRMIVISSGVVTTLAGSSTSGHADGTGAAASFNYPTGVCTDGTNVYVADNQNNEVRQIVISSGVVTTLAGTTTSGSADGTGAAASFNSPCGVCADGLGNLYVADRLNNEIRKIVISSGVVTTLAGSTTSGSTNGTGAAASFHGPTGLTVDGAGNLFVADQSNNEIRKIVISTAVVTTFAGTTTSGSTDAIGALASFNIPSGICSDGTNLYVSDYVNNEIRKIVIATAAVTTYAGTTTSGHADGTGAAASFDNPYGIGIDLSGNVYVGDQTNQEVRMIASITGVNNISNLLSTSVYPNPARQKLYVKFSQTLQDAAIIKILDITGKEVMTFEHAQGESVQIDISSLVQGIYFVQTITNNNTVVEKFIKQ